MVIMPILTFGEYQEAASQTAQYPNRGSNFIYPALGLCGESGEVAEKFKKAIRNDNGIITPETREGVKKELGDVMWYISAICDEMGFELADVATQNIQKLRDRQNRGVIKSTGDNR
jgi:NTP pyrophosphatase (non-canonical NTP hydrolase)